MNMYRGIFRVTIFRNILYRLIFNDESETIDKNLTESNVGGRRGHNIWDNIFVVNAIINGQKQKILFLFSSPGVTKLTLMLFIRGNNLANLLVLLK